MKNKIKAIFLLEAIGVVAVVLLVGYLISAISSNEGKSIFGGSSPYESRALQTATSTVGPSAVVVIREDRKNCAGVFITTNDSNDVRISFDDLTPTASVGHLLASSTNNYFGGDEYGCGEIKAFGVGASSTITISEFIW